MTPDSQNKTPAMKNDSTPQTSAAGSSDLLGELEYIAASPAQKHGGFHPRVVAAAAGSLHEIKRLHAVLASMQNEIDQLRRQRLTNTS